jgi:hypothetical protein
MILDPEKHPDLSQNLIDWSLARAQSSLKVSSKFVHNLLRYLASRQTDRQTDKQTDRGENITSLAEVITDAYALDLKFNQHNIERNTECEY